MKLKMKLNRMSTLPVLLAALAVGSAPAWASSHSDAPLIKLDPQANLTDVYAFIRQPGGVKTLNIMVNVRPFSNSGDGVTYEKFSDDALYSVHIADPVTGATRCRYDFKFSTVTNAGNKNLNTILNYGLGTEAGPIEHVGDARQNYTQTYSITKVTATSSVVIASGLKVPPPNVGPRTTPYYNDTDTSSPTYGKALSGATSVAGLDRYTQETLYTLAGGETVFCGSRDDSFYSDIPGIFDLLNPRILAGDGKGADDFKGYNVLSYCIRLPLSKLDLSSGPTVGVYASVSRPRITLRKTDGEPVHSGPWIQVNRLGNPLFNEALVRLADKDNYNRASPTEDAVRFKKYAEKPEIAFLINFVYGDFLMGAFGRKLKETGRTDIAGIFTPDVVKVDTSTGPVPVPGEAGFHRLSFLGGDFTSGKPSGWPNGRRIGDDVIDIALIAIANAPGESPTIILGDNVDHNDVPYHTVFPYVATPHSGTFIRHDPEP